MPQEILNRYDRSQTPPKFLVHEMISCILKQSNGTNNIDHNDHHHNNNYKDNDDNENKGHSNDNNNNHNDTITNSKQ